MIQANTQNQTSNFGNVELQYLPHHNQIHHVSSRDKNPWF